MMEYLAVAQSRTGKIEDVALCNAYSLALRYAEQFAAAAPSDALVMVYECKQMSVYSGRLPDPEAVEQTQK